MFFFLINSRLFAKLYTEFYLKKPQRNLHSIRSGEEKKTMRLYYIRAFDIWLSSVSIRFVYLTKKKSWTLIFIYKLYTLFNFYVHCRLATCLYNIGGSLIVHFCLQLDLGLLSIWSMNRTYMWSYALLKLRRRESWLIFLIMSCP